MILQNRGRQSSVQLARELDVTPRTILRDVEALAEAGLPVVARRGQGGGIELGTPYPARLAGLAPEEAEALGVILNQPNPVLEAVGISDAARRARAKLIESLPDGLREKVVESGARFGAAPPRAAPPDPRIALVARAIRGRLILRLRARSPAPQTVYPAALVLEVGDWILLDARKGHAPIPLRAWGDIEISSRPFPALDEGTARPQTSPKATKGSADVR